MGRQEMDATTRNNYRSKIFLGLIFILCLWDIAFFLGIRDLAQIPHPFAVFRSLGDIEFLRGFSSMLREIIFTFVSGGLVGIGIGATVLYTPSLTAAALRFLRIALLVPFIIAYAVFAPLFWEIMTAMLCAAYHYLAARAILKIRGG
jgi:ABC-type nitrate/sulfonate/bicarbonate transport system permease component